MTAPPLPPPPPRLLARKAGERAGRTMQEVFSAAIRVGDQVRFPQVPEPPEVER